MKLVSIIIPIYNSSKYISACVDSVLAQTHKKLDILLIDDGSSDNSYELCKEFREKDDRIRVFHHDNQGVSFSRNVGIEKAKGDYIMFVDSDDTILPDMVEKYVSIAERTSADIVIGGILFDSIEKIEKKLPPKDVDRPEKAINYIVQGYRGIFGYVPNKIYKQSLLVSNNIRFLETIDNQEDLLFFVDAVDSAKKIETIQYAGYIYNNCEGEKPTSFKVLIANQIHIIRKACKYQKIDINPVKNRIGRLLAESLLNSKNDISIPLIKSYLSIDGIIKSLDSATMESKNEKLIVWMAQKRLYYLLYLYVLLRR